MHVKLKVLRGASAGKEVGISGTKFFIGRAPECNLRANSEAISRRHCAITVSSDQIAIRDLGSRNGTLVNGEKISGIHELKVGDQLRVGPLEFLVTFVRETKAAVAAAPSSPPAEDDEMSGLIGDWLAEADETQPTQIMDTETREYRFDETDRIDVPKVDVPAAKPTAEETAEEKEEKKQADVKPTPRRSGAQPAPKDTQEAAAQTLRKFFNRGG